MPSTAKYVKTACYGHEHSNVHRATVEGMNSTRDINETARGQQNELRQRKVRCFMRLFEIVYYISFWAKPLSDFAGLRRSHERNGVFDGYEDLLSAHNLWLHT